MNIKKANIRLPKLIVLLGFSFVVLFTPLASAHHVLGRPAYSLNEDSNTPPSMNIETLIGDFFVTAMVFPAFPKPEQAGRINLYVTRLGTKQPLNSDIEFSVRSDGWFSSLWFSSLWFSSLSGSKVNPKSSVLRFWMITSIGKVLTFTSVVTTLLALHLRIKVKTT